jgi:uncharacterized caspase-like protein/tetratricopeptide (TPR) repeat protein
MRSSVVHNHVWLTSICLALLFYVPSIVSAQVAPEQGPAVPNADSRDLKHVRPNENTVPQTATAVPQSYALVVGISHYQNLPSSAQLNYPEVDAKSIYSTLISAQGGQFPAEHVHLLVGDQATRAGVLRELEQWLAATTTPNDRVVIYFAGHGFISDGKGYLAPYDIDLHNIAGTAIPMDLLGRLTGSTIKGKWKVLLSDACHSGAITPETDPGKLNQFLLNLNESIFSLTASRDRERSFESKDWGGGHGIFTYYVVQGLSGAADANGDGVVTADELAEYVRTNVRAATNAQQNPTSDRGSFDPNMVLAYNPDHTKGTVAGLAFGTLIIQSNMDNTEFWLDDKLIGVVNKGAALRLPGVRPGSHTIKAVHMGYEPDGPREELVYPGQETTVNLRILIPRHRTQAAVDLLNQGVSLYKDGAQRNYEKAESKLHQAIAVDPTYSEAYVYLGRVENALWKDEESVAAFHKALEIDPDFEDAKVSYAAALLDQGGLDEAVRQLNSALLQKPNDSTAFYLLSQAYARKGDFADGKTAALKAVKAAPGNGEAHFWLAECERHLNEAPDAEAEYKEYLSLTNYNSGALGNANYYILGSLIGLGTKHRAAQQDIWREQHGQANLGICDCEWMQKRDDAAVPFCKKALDLMPSDLWANYRLGLIYVEQANAQAHQSTAPTASQAVLDLLKEAKLRFGAVISSNPDTDEAGRARQYVAKIDAALATHP